MPQIISDLFRFIYTTLSYWQAYATGSVVTGVVGLVERLTKWKLTKRVYLSLFVGVFLFVSFFMGWRDEREERLRQQAEVSKLLQNKPQLRGEIQYFRSNTVDDGSSVGVVMILGVSNVGTIPSIAEEWNCYFEFMDGQGNLRRILGQARAVPDDLVLNRRNLGGHLKTGHTWSLQNRPMASGRD
jgi:hypothetical protein